MKDQQVREIRLKLTTDGARALEKAVSTLMNRTTEPWASQLRDISHQLDQFIGEDQRGGD